MITLSENGERVDVIVEDLDSAYTAEFVGKLSRGTGGSWGN